MLQTVRRLPGIRFETQAPLSPEVLPRMDIAGFVGFAASGPLHVPVPVEDAAQFAQIFGADAPLAWDAARGEQAYAYLGPAVRAFFRNGGRRCWVVRVANEKRAVRDSLPVPGIAQVSASGTISPALLEARSAGSWADGLRVSSWLSPTPLRLQSAGPGPAALEYEALVASAGEVVRGDLIRVSFPGSPWTLLFTVRSVGPTVPASPPAPPALVDGVQLQRLRVRGEDPFWVRVAQMTPFAQGHVHYLGSRGEHHVAAATVEQSSRPEPDGLVRISLGGGGGSPAEPPVSPTAAPPRGALVRGVFNRHTVWIDIADVEASPNGSTTLVGLPMQVKRAAPVPLPVQAPDAFAERLTLTLRTGDDTSAIELGGLGFAPAHPRFLGALPGDDELYADPDAPPAKGSLAAAAAQPRFPLAGPDVAPAHYLPLGLSILPSDPLPAIRPPGSERLRDGLRRFGGALFLDSQLVDTDPRLLLDEADWIRYRSPNPRPLRGAHALLGIDEVTIVAAPDAVQLGWLRGRAAHIADTGSPEPAPEPDWSRFLDCATHVPSAPELTQQGDEEGGVFTLVWTATDAPDAVYELQEDVVPAFDGAETIWSGPEREFSLYGRPAGSTLFFRVRASAGGTEGGWSNTHVVRTTQARRWFVPKPSSYSPAGLVSLQLALLRLCAARGDLFAVLALPEHFRERAAAAHVRALRAAAGRPGGEPDPVFGYGAVYHPWLYASDPATPTAFRRTPPDGAAAGVIAARAIQRGAWVAPANEPLRDVYALDPAIGPEAYQLLQDAQVNLVRQEPGGFLWLAADTLSEDENLRPIGVRRLLQVLRRAALLHGAVYTFEPNGDPLRRAVRRTFEKLLTRMYELGAFSGATAAESFRVNTGSPPNTPESVDQGRLIVELQVAPSRPLAFLTVRLVRTGAGLLQLESR